MRSDLASLLVVDDDGTHRDTLVELARHWDFNAFGVESGEKAVALVRGQPFDLVLMDMRMPGLSGQEALEEIKRYNPSIPVIIMTAYSEVETAVKAVKAGAYDYLIKPLDFDDLQNKLQNALEHLNLRKENQDLRTSLKLPDSGSGLIARSMIMRRLLDMLTSIAPTNSTVLITGESGTGKEVAARCIHDNSGRGEGPFVAVNCAALSEPLLESELFGHEKGAFTGADKRREGRFMAAEGGTLFLDEIGELPLSMQPKLLRAIQEREIQRVGGDVPGKVDVRIMAATNQDLDMAVKEGRFRQDLYYRLNVVKIELPPLRERIDDIPLLAAHFLKTFAERNGKPAKGFSPGAMDCLLKYPWPGNVRELENVVERAVVLLFGEYVGERELPPGMFAEAGGDEDARMGLSGMTLEEVERLAIVETLEECNGNKTEAAKRLGITRKTLAVKLRGNRRE